MKVKIVRMDSVEELVNRKVKNIDKKDDRRASLWSEMYFENEGQGNTRGLLLQNHILILNKIITNWSPLESMDKGIGAIDIRG